MQLLPKLKPLPCPFCGKIPTVKPKYPDEYLDFGEVICYCRANPSVFGYCKGKVNKGAGYYADIAIKRWNKRTPIAPSQEVENTPEK